MNDDFLRERLRARSERGALRRLIPESDLADFTSNDYLGVVHQALLLSNETAGESGSTGSRLLTGNQARTEALEARIADFHGAPAALIFNSGFGANLGLLSVVPEEGDVVLYDEQVHASIRDGMRLGRASCFPFRHNDLEHLARRLNEPAARETARRFVVVESIYSMDGDTVDLGSLCDLCESTDSYLLVDEAHATGVDGREGRGRVDECDCTDRVFARVHTFGKAFGAHGAAVVGSTALREALVNFAHSFIYTTALPPHSIRTIETAYDVVPTLERERRLLRENVAHFLEQKSRFDDRWFTPGTGPIQGILLRSNPAAREFATRLAEAGIDARPILSPTVQRGRERTRISIHAFNTREQIDRIFGVLETWTEERDE